VCSCVAAASAILFLVFKVINRKSESAQSLEGLCDPEAVELQPPLESGHLPQKRDNPLPVDKGVPSASPLPVAKPPAPPPPPVAMPPPQKRPPPAGIPSGPQAKGATPQQKGVPGQGPPKGDTPSGGSTVADMTALFNKKSPP
jgi:hypothetical protein